MNHACARSLPCQQEPIAGCSPFGVHGHAHLRHTGSIALQLQSDDNSACSNGDISGAIGLSDEGRQKSQLSEVGSGESFFAYQHCMPYARRLAT